MMEEYEILRTTVREFVDKNIENIALNIEKDGIKDDLIAKLGSQGFLTARVPVESGGSGLDDRAYMIILEEIARSSPSVAMKVFITNMFFDLYNPGNDTVNAVASGKMNVSVAFPEIYKESKETGDLRIENGKLRGIKRNVINGNCGMMIVSSSDGKNLYLVRSGFTAKGKSHLGIRGLDFSDVEFDTGDYEAIQNRNYGNVTSAITSSGKFISAIFTGLSEGTVDKAIEYSKVRFAFDHPLMDYGPIASSLSFMKMEIDMIRSFSYSASDSYETALSKIKAKAVSVDAARLALQVHGGYGYIEDFGIEKFYRDAMALSIIFGNDDNENTIVSEHIFGGKSGSV